MSEYEISKIDVNGYNGDGSRAYTNSRSFGTAQEMFDYLNHSDANNNGIFCGKGSDIFFNSEIIAHTNDYQGIMMPETNEFTGNEVKPRPSIKKLIEHAEMMSENA